MDRQKEKGVEEIPVLTERGARIWHSEELFRGGRQVVIAHGGSHYRLLITRTGKLILNK